jgi:hypothetical protein
MAKNREEPEHKDDVEYLEDDNDEEYLEEPDNKGFLDNNATPGQCVKGILNLLELLMSCLS